MARPVRLSGIGQIAEWTRRWADLQALRGILALESGRPNEAAEDFKAALSVNNSPGAAASVVAVLTPASPLERIGVLAHGATTKGTPPFQFDYAPIAGRYLFLLRRAIGD